MAIEILKLEDTHHYLSKKLEVFFAILLKVEIFR